MRAEEIAHAREVDTRIANAWIEYYRITTPLPRYRKALLEAKRSREWFEGKGFTNRALDEQQSIERTSAAIAKLEAQAEPFRALAHQIDEDEYTGWTRFFLVQHIHNTRYCSSFRPTTRVGWLPDVSGLTEAEAVAEHGATLCTICFPTAPTELTAKQADPNTCPGSGKYIPYDKTIRSRGKYAECPECAAIVYRTPGSGNLRKHKRGAIS